MKMRLVSILTLVGVVIIVCILLWPLIPPYVHSHLDHTVVDLIGHLAWPITILILVFVFIDELRDLGGRIVEFGGVKFTINDLHSVSTRAEEIGLVSDPLTDEAREEYIFQTVAPDDPSLALAGFRIELEKRLKKLAELNDIGTHMRGVGSLVRDLQRKEILGHKESSVISDIIGTLNSAIHAEHVDPQAVGWVVDFGPRLLRALDEKIPK